MVFSLVVPYGQATAHGANPSGLSEDEIVEQVVSRGFAPAADVFA